MSEIADVVIVDIKRTAIGSFQGALGGLSATELGATVIRELLRQNPQAVDAVIMGQVLSAGCGQAPARQAALGAGLDISVPCTTINKVCGSGLEAVIQGTAMIQSGQAEVVVAGGMESMSNCPYLLDRARQGYRLGHGKLMDSIISDGLWDVYNDFHMGEAAELCADTHKISRQAQDHFALRSYERALKAIDDGCFKDEIVACSHKTKRGEISIDADEEPHKVNFEKLPQLKPAFKKEGTVTAANASTLNDGASACILMSRTKAELLGLKPMATIKACNRVAQEPAWFTTAPVKGIQKLLGDLRLEVNSIDLFEINEAFAVVSLAAEKLLELDPEKANVRGGAVALGHPIGASGARILCTLVHALNQNQMKRGIASLCIGGGEACTVLVEREA